MFAYLPLLSLLIWLPVLGGILVLLASKINLNESWIRYLALIISIFSLMLCVPLYTQFDTHTYLMQFTEHSVWIPSYHMDYDLGVDGISMPLIILTAFTTLIVVLASWRMVKIQVAQYLATFLIMQGMVTGIFCALDSILFYGFWEAVLIPMYLSIGIWGSSNRSYAAIKFFLYTFLGSALLLVALLYLGIKAGHFSVLGFYPLPLSSAEQLLVFLAFLFAFAIKVPMWPVHTWLPDAHTEAPAGGSVILAALMLKIGAYGFLRFSLPITPDACQSMAWLMVALSLLAIIYIGFIAVSQTDMKRLIAYSSVAHMGFVTLGCFMIFMLVKHAGNIQDAYMGLDGAMIQMISHGFGSGALFIGFGMLYERMHTRQIKDFGGLAHTMPLFATLFMVFAMTNVGLPGTSGFVGEFMIILSAFKASFWIAFAAGMTLIISASYTLWMYKRVFYGPVKNDSVARLQDIDGLEIVVLVLLAIAVLWFGVYPQPLLEIFHASTGHLLELAVRTKL